MSAFLPTSERPSRVRYGNASLASRPRDRFHRGLCQLGDGSRPQKMSTLSDYLARNLAIRGGGMPGYVYVMTNPHMPGVAKIGRMDRNPAERQSALSRSTSVPANFTIEGVVQVENSCAAEVKLHAVFADARTQRGEFFKSAFRQPSGAELIGNR
jgi:hypothetical protein